MPAAVVRSAKRQLEKLEDDAASRAPQGDLFAPAPKKTEVPVSPALAALREADADALSPRDALELIYRLKKLADDGD